MTVRARSGHLMVRKHDKAGRAYIGQDECVVSRGMFSAKEIEKQLMQAADESEADVVGAHIDVYGDRETPEMEGNPRRSERTHTQFSGFYGTATWPPRVNQTRREQAPSGN